MYSVELNESEIAVCEWNQGYMQTRAQDINSCAEEPSECFTMRVKRSRNWRADAGSCARSGKYIIINHHSSTV